MPTFSESDWEGILRDWTLRMSRYISAFCTHRISVQCNPQPCKRSLDLDEYMELCLCQGVFIHNKHQVLFATLSRAACVTVRSLIASKMGVSRLPNVAVVEGSVQLLDRDRTQEKATKGNHSLICVTFRSSARPQPPNLNSSAQVIGSRHCCFDSSFVEPSTCQSHDKLYRRWYRECCYSAFLTRPLIAKISFMDATHQIPQENLALRRQEV